MPVVNLPYVTKGAAHTSIKPIRPIKPAPAPGNVHYERFTKAAPPSQEAILAAMTAAVAGRAGNSSAGFGAVVDLNTVPEPRRQTMSIDAAMAVLNQLEGASAQVAADAINAYTRARMREDGFFRRIMPPTPLENIEVDRPRFPPADRHAYTEQNRSDLAAQDAVSIQLPSGRRNILRDVNKKTQE